MPDVNTTDNNTVVFDGKTLTLSEATFLNRETYFEIENMKDSEVFNLSHYIAVVGGVITAIVVFFAILPDEGESILDDVLTTVFLGALGYLVVGVFAVIVTLTFKHSIPEKWKYKLEDSKYRPLIAKQKRLDEVLIPALERYFAEVYGVTFSKAEMEDLAVQSMFGRYTAQKDDRHIKVIANYSSTGIVLSEPVETYVKNEELPRLV